MAGPKKLCWLDLTFIEKWIGKRLQQIKRCEKWNSGQTCLKGWREGTFVVKIALKVVVGTVVVLTTLAVDDSGVKDVVTFKGRLVVCCSLSLDWRATIGFWGTLSKMLFCSRKPSTNCLMVSSLLSSSPTSNSWATFFFFFLNFLCLGLFLLNKSFTRTLVTIRSGQLAQFYSVSFYNQGQV